MPRLEEITYEAGRHALADQEALVAGIRQRAGTLLAAHALVASFLGTATLREDGSTALTLGALAALVAGPVIAAILLAPWKFDFTITADDIYEMAKIAATETSDADSLAWLVGVGFAYQRIRDANTRLVKWMARLSIALATLVLIHATLWIGVLIDVR